jgi:N-acetylglucosamine-6-phosphate deacetylase
MLFTTITNCRLCKNGQLTEGERLIFSEDNGEFLQETGYIGGEIIDLDDNIIAPGFLELQTNGVNGFHFTHFESEEQYVRKLEETAKFYLSQGVTGFWVTIPTVAKEIYKKVNSPLFPSWITKAISFLHSIIIHFGISVNVLFYEYDN